MAVPKNGRTAQPAFPLLVTTPLLRGHSPRSSPALGASDAPRDERRTRETRGEFSRVRDAKTRRGAGTRRMVPCRMSNARKKAGGATRGRRPPWRDRLRRSPKARARVSRYPTSDCSQEKRRKSGKSRRCRPISALLNENRLHHGRGRARASHPSARFWAVPVGARCPLAHPLAPSVSHGRPSIEERVRLEFRSLPHRRRTTGRALASRQRVDKAGTLPVKARWWPSR